MKKEKKCVECELKQCGMMGDTSREKQCFPDVKEEIKSKLRKLTGELKKRTYKTLEKDENEKIVELILKSLMLDKSFAASLSEVEADIRTWNKFIENYLYLEHEYHASRGLWCTDMPDMIPAEQKKNFFQLK